MIDSIAYIGEKTFDKCAFKYLNKYKVEIDTSGFSEICFTIKITFKFDIIACRNHDYTWIDLNNITFSNWYSPKILKLENNQFVQSNQQIGIWEVSHAQPKILRWHFNPKYSKPITTYDGLNSKQIVEARSAEKTDSPLTLLFPKEYGIEFSRSKIPFSAIFCFTDHCDFDTLENLIQQREFFKKYGIKITKGFFLNHYSKREVTACNEFHNDELLKWKTNGHELAYHSLSQSVKPLEESIKDFKRFEPPFSDISLWIDHGFQPYNLSLYQNHRELNADYGITLKEKGIDTLWNYIDSGTTAKGVINQINPTQFNLYSFSKGIKHLGYKSAVPMLVKNILLHYFDDDEKLNLYRDVAKYLKSFNRKKSFKKHVNKFFSTLEMAIVLLPFLVLWKFKKRTIYPLAKFSPLIFDHEISGKSFVVFQTVEMIDFKMALCKGNIDLMIKESGVCIAHTYFSAPMNYHKGKLFGNGQNIDIMVEENFDYLSQKIQSSEIWNPTLTELVDYFQKLKLVKLDCNEHGELKVVDQQLPYREVR